MIPVDNYGQDVHPGDIVVIPRSKGWNSIQKAKVHSITPAGNLKVHLYNEYGKNYFANVVLVRTGNYLKICENT